MLVFEGDDNQVSWLYRVFWTHNRNVAGSAVDDNTVILKPVSTVTPGDKNGGKLWVLKKLGCVSSAKCASTQESDVLSRLQAGIDGRLAEIGFEADEKRFVPHLTLCRVKDFAVGKQLKRIIPAFEGFSAGKIQVKSICVYKSELTKTGPEYTLLSRNDLV